MCINRCETPHAVSTWAIQSIHDYCETRDLKCEGCRYSVHIVCDGIPYDECIFQNCPCDWNTSEQAPLGVIASELKQRDEDT